MKTRPSCFGTILPDLSKLNFNRPTEGKAFNVFVEKIDVAKRGFWNGSKAEQRKQVYEI